MSRGFQSLPEYFFTLYLLEGRPVYSIDTSLIRTSRPICPFVPNIIHYL
nr:MAG TPA: hypothetical protein [Bacteriophage sp.]